MRNYKARGIVLHTIKYGDSGLVAQLLTDVGGRQSYMVQGVRSSRGHGNRAALLQPMFLVEFEGMESPRAEMHRFREIRAAVPLGSIPFDVRKSTVALFMAEMLYRLVREVEANSPLFDFVWDSVCRLDFFEDRAGVANFHLWFMVGLSRHLGFFPAGEWSAGHWFDIREGIFTPIEPRGECFSRENAALLGSLMDAAVAADCDVLATLQLNRVQRSEFMNSMLAYFGYHLDAVRDIRSVDILREVF
ncbi:MAG: recombination protein O N-terminal domain-containing protein [Alistipes sp.]|jgi:DNA repair protein RecO (recombination protein O)|nr:recombination protein O N-terminal domain-containing protein [Alistipes sp.]